MDPKIILSFVLGIALAAGVSIVATRHPAPAPSAPVPVQAVVPAKAVEETVPVPVPAAKVEEPIRQAQAQTPQPPSQRSDAQKPPVQKLAPPAILTKAEVTTVLLPPEPEKPAIPEAAPVPRPAESSAVARIFEPKVPEPRPEPVPEPIAAKPPAKTEPHSVTLTQGTILKVRILERLSSEKNHAGDTFLITLDEPLAADGFVIAERGAHGEGKVVEVQEAGRVKGLARLAVELTQFTSSDGQRVDIKTQTVEREGESSRKQDAAKIGIGAAIGAAAGAAASGGKGAGIGAAAGGAAGAGAVLLTRGKPAVIPSESKVTFRLDEPVTLTERSAQ
jgi:hypothetical protein